MATRVDLSFKEDDKGPVNIPVPITEESRDVDRHLGWDMHAVAGEQAYQLYFQLPRSCQKWNCQQKEGRPCY